MNKFTQTFAFAAFAATALASAGIAQQVTTTKAVAVETTVETQTAAMVATHTVQSIMASPKEDAKVTLIGTIGAKVGDEKYAFTDRTGTIQVEIDDDDLPAGMKLGQMVRIDGEIDNTGFWKTTTQVDAERVTLL